MKMKMKMKMRNKKKVVTNNLAQDSKGLDHQRAFLNNVRGNKKRLRLCNKLKIALFNRRYNSKARMQVELCIHKIVTNQREFRNKIK